MLVAALLSLAAVGPVPGIGRLQEDALRVGLHEASPFAFRAEDGEPSGFAIEVLREVAALEGRELVFVDGSWSECLERLTSGEIDLLLPIRKHPARAGILDLSREEMILTWGSVFTRAGRSLNELRELDGRRIAVVREDAFQDVLAKLLEVEAIDAEFVELDDAPAVLEHLRTGLVDACFLERFAGLHLGGDSVAESVFLLAGHTGLHVAAPKGHYEDFLGALDRRLAAWKADPDSVYQTKLDDFVAGLRPRRLPTWVRLSLLAGGGLLLLLGTFNALLRRQVRRRTAELHARNRELESSETRLRLITDALPALIATLDERGNFRFCNAGASSWFGVPAAEVLGRPFLEIVGDGAREVFQPLLRSARTDAPASHDAELTLPDGSRRWVHAVIAPQLGDRGGGFLHILLVDVTEVRRAEDERRRLEDRLNKSQRLEAVGRLAGGVAHDFRNLLTVITIQADLIENQLTAESELQPAVHSIRSALDHAQGITHSLLAFARRTQTNKEPLDLRHLLDRSRRMLELLLPENVELRVESSDPSPWVEADPHQLQQVFLNLSLNARDAMPDGGRLTIRMEEEDDWARVSFSDTGTGIDAADLEQIFEPFFTTKEEDRGMGLGLAMVQGIVQEHGGRIEVRSDPAEGTTFELLFPRISPPGDRPAAGPAPRRTAALAIDSQQVRHIVAATLATQGFEVSSIEAAQLDARLLDTQAPPFDLLVVDADEPGGQTALETLRRTASSTPMLVLAGPSPVPEGVPLHDRAILLQRPFPMSRLAAAVTELVDPEPVTNP